MDNRVSECPGCVDNQLYRARSKPPMKLVNIQPKVMFKIHLDLTGRITNEFGESQVLITGVGAFTKFVEAARKNFL